MTDPEKLIDGIPMEVRIAIRELGENDLNWALIQVLLTESEPLTFDDLVERIDTDPDEIEDAISRLQTGGITVKRVGDRMGSHQYGKYSLSDFGRSLIYGLQRAYAPRADEEELIDLPERVARRDEEPRETNKAGSDTLPHPRI